VDPDLDLGPQADERARRAGVIEVDVGQEQRTRHLVAQRLDQRAMARLGAGVHEHPVEGEAADDPLAAQVPDIDLAQGGGPYNPGSS
jgi:hypothetical protein